MISRGQYVSGHVVQATKWRRLPTELNWLSGPGKRHTGTRQSLTHIEQRAWGIHREGLLNQIPVLTPGPGRSKLGKDNPGICEIWIQIWKLKMTAKTIRENAFEQKKKKPGLNLTLG